MFKNYLKIAFRNLWRNKLYAAINILGLALGMACTLLLYLYIRHELGYESNHTNANRIYRVCQKVDIGDKKRVFIHTPGRLAPVLQKDYPEVENTARVYVQPLKYLLTYKNKSLYENNIVQTEPSYFKVFSQSFIAGTPEVLNTPKSLVLTKSLAEKMFGSTHLAMNQSVRVDSITGYVVRGVVEDSPVNSHLSPSGFMSHNQELWNLPWMMNADYTYVLLKQGQKIAALNAKMPALVKKYIEPDIPPGLDVKMKLAMYPITKIHFDKEQEGVGNLNSIYLFSVIAVFILLIASINYMNLATTKSIERAKEIGIRKVVGSRRSQLIGQFMTEAVLFTSISLLISLSLVELFLPAFNYLAQKSLMLDFSSFHVIGALLCIVLFVGVVSGLYPAFYLSAFNPIMVLKGKFARSYKGATLRKSLVVVQFIISMVMIVGTLVVYKQMNYVKNKDLGFDKDQIVVIESRLNNIQQLFPLMKKKLLENPKIRGVSFAAEALGGIGSGERVEVRNEAGESTQEAFNLNLIGYDYIDMMGIKLMAGRNFSREFASDSNAVIVNELFVKQQGWKQPIGKKIGYALDRKTAKPTKFAKIIGVVKDYHTQSLYTKIKPYMLWIKKERHQYNQLLVKVQAKEIQQTLAGINDVWQSFEKTIPSGAYFLEQNYLRAYKADEHRGTIFFTFSILAIFIACMGLFALATYTISQRMKEIGIRKVLGASTHHLVHLVTNSFVKLIVLASLIAFPIAWYFMHTWLQDFAYRVTIGWQVFAVAGGLTLVVALFTVGTQAIKATLVNPAEVLKDE